MTLPVIVPSACCAEDPTANEVTTAAKRAAVEALIKEILAVREE
jgi:hypothetical protein